MGPGQSRRAAAAQRAEHDALFRVHYPTVVVCRVFRTTRPDPGAVRPPDRVGRDFTACRPHELWVVGFT